MNQKRLPARAVLRAVAFALSVGLVTASGTAQATPLIGDQTIVLLTSAGALGDAGISLSGLGTAVLGPDIVGRPEAAFPITGGDLTGLSGTIDHDGSGIRLDDTVNQLDFENLLIDFDTLLVAADVSLNGGVLGNAALFSVEQCTSLFGTPGQCIDGDGSILLDGWKLSLTETAVSVLNEVFDIPDLAVGSQAGVARIDVRFVPEPGTALLVGLGLIAAASRGRKLAR